jgi:hypothetical protein
MLWKHTEIPSCKDKFGTYLKKLELPLPTQAATNYCHKQQKAARGHQLQALNVNYIMPNRESFNFCFVKHKNPQTNPTDM